MNDLLINALYRQKNEVDKILSRGLGIARTGPLVGLAENLSSPLIKVIVGPRRAGKSTLCFQALKDESFAYVNFEDEALLAALQQNDDLMDGLDQVFPNARYYFFDEIQNLPSWEQFLNRQHRRGRNLLVTGSNARLLGGELATALTGRHITHELLPFTFTEFVEVRGASASKVPLLTQREAFAVWLRSGGFPDVVTGAASAKAYLTELFDATILRDVVGRHRVRNSFSIRSLAELLINSIGKRFTARSLERTLPDVSFSTIQRYLSHLRDAYLLFDLQAFSFKTRRRIASERKIFTIDNGFISAKASLPLGGETELLENFVFIELKRRGYIPNVSLFYAQTKQGYEVDFFLPQFHSGATLIQVSYSLATASTLERELRSLICAAEEFRANRLLIVTFDERRTYSRDGITIEVVPALEWCSSPEWG